MGDLKEKRLAIEFMGKYSNIILINDEHKVIDAIRHVSPLVSSVRTVLPGSDYFLPDAANKLNPLEVTREAFREGLSYEDTLCANICNRYTGLS